ncbi:hypothetical protein D3C73_1478950 [compost metagenome]
MQFGQEEGRHRGQQHAQPRPADTAACGHRRGHALQAEQEQGGGDQVAGLDQPIEQFDGADVQACGSFGSSLPVLRTLGLNISSMRAVTT